MDLREGQSREKVVEELSRQFPHLKPPSAKVRWGKTRYDGFNFETAAAGRRFLLICFQAQSSDRRFGEADTFAELQEVDGAVLLPAGDLFGHIEIANSRNEAGALEIYKKGYLVEGNPYFAPPDRIENGHRIWIDGVGEALSGSCLELPLRGQLFYTLADHRIDRMFVFTCGAVGAKVEDDGTWQLIYAKPAEGK